MRTCFLLSTFFFIQTIFPQKSSLSESSIPTELKINANAIVQDSKKSITLDATDKMFVKLKLTLTVLNQKGNNALDSYLHYSDDIKINHLSLVIFDAFGEQIKKFSKSKFIDVSAVDGVSLYNDARLKYVDYTPNTYPYTAVFEYEYSTSSTGFIPSWYPIDAYNLAVQRSAYVIHNPNDLNIRTKENNFNNYNIKNISENGIHYVMENQPAIKYESNSYSYVNILPSLLAAADSFTLKGVKGEAKDWKSFGKWMHKELLSGKAILDEKTIAKAKDLVKNAKNDIEKAKILYNYMQNKTRYISVQIGIGGWEPISAVEVNEVGYGDCKGLTNYTKALFDAVGINSYYTIVYAKNKRDIDSSFSSIQGNHAILNLPLNGTDIWLECTSQTLPFGFLGDFTDDRNVLVVTPEGGKIKRTSAYKNEANLQTTQATLILDANGSATAEVERVSKGIQYNNIYHIENYSKKDLDEYYKTKAWSYINNLEIKTAELSNNKDSIFFTEKLKLSIKDFASINQGEYIFSVNTFNKDTHIPRRYRTRNLPLEIKRGYKDVAEFIFKIPDGYTFGLPPEKKHIKTRFGEYMISVQKINDKTLLYKKTLLIKEGIYPKEDYKAYRMFRKQIAKQENLKLILKHTNQ